MTSLFPKGLNGNAGSMIAMTEETKAKISDANKGKTLPPRSEEHRKNLSEANKDKTFSEESRRKMSDAQKGENNSMFGKTHTDETIRKMSEAMKGKNKGKPKPPRSEEHRKNLSEGMKGVINVLNIETGEKERITTELYHSHRNIYFSTTSKVYKDWKSNHTSQHSF